MSGSKRVVLEVSGMSCGHCVGRVENALKGVRGVQAVKVDLADGLATIVHHGVDASTLIAALVGIGYDAKES
jgi:copper chaperone CopZ